MENKNQLLLRLELIKVLDSWKRQLKPMIWKGLDEQTYLQIKELLKMKQKTINWYSENLYQRIQTTWTFIRASCRMLMKGKVSIRVKFMNL